MHEGFGGRLPIADRGQRHVERDGEFEATVAGRTQARDYDTARPAANEAEAGA